MPMSSAALANTTVISGGEMPGGGRRAAGPWLPAQVHRAWGGLCGFQAGLLLDQ